MKDVKGNGHCIIFGDQETDTTFQSLEVLNIFVPATTCTYINSESFKYNHHSQKNTRLHSKKTKCILECLHLLNLNEIIRDVDKERIGIYLNTSHDTSPKDFPEFEFQPAESGYFQKFKKTIPPTHSIRGVAGILPGHIAVFHEIHGPTFAETSLVGTSVFEKAQIDLETGMIDLGIVALVNCYDDNMTMAIHAKHAGKKKLIEATGIFIIDKNNPHPPKINLDKNYYYGFLENINTPEI